MRAETVRETSGQAYDVTGGLWQDKCHIAKRSHARQPCISFSLQQIGDQARSFPEPIINFAIMVIINNVPISLNLLGTLSDYMLSIFSSPSFSWPLPFPFLLPNCFPYRRTAVTGMEMQQDLECLCLRGKQYFYIIQHPLSYSSEVSFFTKVFSLS